MAEDHLSHGEKLMRPCPKCGDPVHPENTGFHVCREPLSSKTKVPKYGNQKRRALRNRLMDLQAGLCWLCGAPMSTRQKFRQTPIEATFDHIKALAHGGADTVANVRLAHRACNCIRGELQAAGNDVEGLWA